MQKFPIECVCECYQCSCSSFRKQINELKSRCAFTISICDEISNNCGSYWLRLDSTMQNRYSTGGISTLTFRNYCDNKPIRKISWICTFALWISVKYCLFTIYQELWSCKCINTKPAQTAVFEHDVPLRCALQSRKLQNVRKIIVIYSFFPQIARRFAFIRGRKCGMHRTIGPLLQMGNVKYFLEMYNGILA